MTHVLTGIDPRIRARRVAVRRAEGRRRLRFLVGAVAVVLVLVGAWGLTRTPVLDLDHVRIDGVVAGSVAEIDEVIEVAPGTPLLDVDTAAIAGRVRALPWVHTAEVRRDWPGTLRVDVVERVPVALIPAGEGSHAAIDASSVVIGVRAAVAEPALPVIDVALGVAPGEMQMSATPGLAVVATLPADLEPWIERIRVETGAATTLSLDLVGSAVARLGDTALLGDKLEALRAVLAGADLSCVVTIDVSVADLSTLTRDPVCDGSVASGDA